MACYVIAMAWWLALVLSQLPPGVETRTVMVDHGVPCPQASQSSVCDDPSVVMPTVGEGSQLDQVVFIGKKPGTTTCSCGLSRGFRFVWQITVVSTEEGAEIAAARVVDAALKRLSKLSPQPR